MKYLWAFLLVPISALALECHVDGITDSPQEMNCYIHEQRLIQVMNLKCLKGNYLLKWKNKSFPIDVAYHEEVEFGSAPLVFRSGNLSLTTTLFPLYYKADLIIDTHKYDGLCFHKASH